MGVSGLHILTGIGVIAIVGLILKASDRDHMNVTKGDGSSESLARQQVPNRGEAALKQLARQQLIEKLIQQRNNVSRELNMKQRTIGQMECAKKRKDKAVSKTGGWCKTPSKEGGGEHVTDKDFAKALAEFYKGKSVASFGDGPGRYKQLILDTGKVKGYDAYDGAPFCEETSEGRVQYLDLTLPQYGLPLYDWVMSLEVAEHIPSQFQTVYMDNIVRHAKEGVMLSWSRPKQGGFSHVNEKPLEYVKELFDSLGFSHDEVESKKVQDATVFPWLKANVNVYRRRDKRAFEGLSHYFT